MTVKMIHDLRKRMEAQIEKMQDVFNKDLEELKNKQTEINSTITKMRNTLEGINNRITEAEKWIIELEDRKLVYSLKIKYNLKKKEKKKGGNHCHGTD